jgi:hypothetical protein
MSETPREPTHALTLTQPWATLVACGEKMIETRGWGTAHRGPIAIHAAKGFPRDAIERCFDEPFASALRACGITKPGDLPRGEIVAVADLRECYRISTFTALRIEMGDVDLPAHEYSFGNYDYGRYAFALANLRRLATPIPARGMLSLWRIPEDARAALTAQLLEPAHAR